MLTATGLGFSEGKTVGEQVRREGTKFEDSVACVG